MSFSALATDFDGTLAEEGRVADATIAALERFVASGRDLILATGRELPELRSVFPHLDLFSRIVAENGALLYWPARDAEQPLAPPPPPGFVARLRDLGVSPLSQGRVIVATRTPHEAAVLAAIRELGLALEVIFNKGAVMVLPPNVNKATGLSAALRDLAVSPDQTAAIGDAENDHAFLAMSGFAVAVANALPQLKAEADWVTPGAAGAGVVDLIERILEDRAISPSRAR